jgi:hypothetical protein
MANKRLERMKIKPVHCEALASVGVLTAKDMLTANPFTLVGQTEVLGYDELLSIRHQVSASIAPKPSSALQLYMKRNNQQPQQQQQVATATSTQATSSSTGDSASGSNKRIGIQDHVPTGLASLDQVLRGGLSLGTITEIVGPPGIGKSQFCMNVCVQLLVGDRLSGNSSSSSGVSNNASIVYIDTEQKFDPNRLMQIVRANLSGTGTSSGAETPVDMDALLSRIKVGVRVRRRSWCFVYRFFVRLNRF